MLKKLMAAVMALLLSGTGFVPASAEEPGSSGEIRILFTHDLHDHELPYRTEDRNGEGKQAGGYAYLKSAVDQNRTENSILVDAGDFSMGSLFSLLFTESAPSLSLLGSMGYDAVTLGSHEFDQGPADLAESIEAGTEIPSIVMANMQYGSDSDAQKLKKVMEEKAAGSYKIVERNGLKIGIFGIMGKSSAEEITNSGGITFSDALEAAENTVNDLEEQDCDVIVALSHSGTDEDSEKSEDEILAREVDGIDVIVSGHTHTVLSEPLQVNDTVIVSAGCYGRYLGVLDLDVRDHSVKNYDLVSIDDSLNADPLMESQLKTYEEEIQNNHLSAYGYRMNEVIAGADFSLDSVDDLYGAFGNSNLGDFVSDAYREQYESWYETWMADFQKRKNAEIDEIIQRKGLDQNGMPVMNPGAAPVQPSASPETEPPLSVKDQLKAAWEGTFSTSEPVSPIDPEVLAVKEKKPAFVNTPVAVTAAGEIGGTILKGDQTIQDVYNTVSSVSGTEGSTMILAFVRGSDLRRLCEIYAAIGQSVEKNARLFFSGMKYDYDNARLPLNRVEETYVEQSQGYFVPVEDEALYPLITSRSVIQMIEKAAELSEGWLTITVNDAEGKEADSLDSLILLHPDTGEEVKSWQAAASYLQGMNSVNGRPMLSESYREADVNKEEDSSFSLIRYFRHTSAFAARVYLIGGIVIAAAAAILTILLRFILNRIHRKED